MSSYIDRLAKASRDELDAPVKRAVKAAIDRAQVVSVATAPTDAVVSQGVVAPKGPKYSLARIRLGPKMDVVRVTMHEPSAAGSTVIVDPSIVLTAGGRVKIKKAKDRSGMYQPAAAKAPANARGPSRKNRGVTR